MKPKTNGLIGSGNMNLTDQQLIALSTLRKRFEYQAIYKTRPDTVFERIMLENNRPYERKALKEFPVTCWLDSYKKAEEKLPFSLWGYYDFIRLVRTGRKIRSIKLRLQIIIYLVKRTIIK